MRVVAKRGSAVESEHPVAAVLFAEGAVRASIGPVEPPVTWRSAAKPFQLEVSLPLTGWSPSERQIAIGASSHWAQPVHTELVEQILTGLGCTEGDLFCGADWPSHPAARKAAIRATDHARALWNNCSGKHAFMAGACRACGWERDYRPVAHPLQAAILARVTERAGAAVETVVDGCGVPCFVLPIGAMGRAWAGLAEEMAAGTSVLGRIARAMAAHPVEIGGEGSIDTAVMRGARQPVVAKVGAEGLINVAIPHERASVTVKVRTGDGSARAVALGALLDRWFPGLVDPAVFAPFAEVRNVVGALVGHRAAV
jgi:L-asparaginase II